LPSGETTTLSEEVQACGFELVIGIDAGGDSIVPEAKSGEEGRDKRMVDALKATQVSMVIIAVLFLATFHTHCVGVRV
jgi:hypothetical protein